MSVRVDDIAPAYPPARGDPGEHVAELVLGDGRNAAEKRRLLLLLEREFDVEMEHRTDAAATYLIFPEQDQ